MSPEKEPFTDHAPCLTGLPDPVLNALRQRASARHYDRGAIIVRQGSLDSRLIFIVQGRLKLTRLSGVGRLRTLRILNQGDCFCTAPLNSAIPSPVTVECHSDAEVAFLRGDEVASLLAEIPGGTRGMVTCLSGRLSEAMREAADAPHLPVSRKLAGVLADLVRARGGAEGGPVTLEGITHEELASLAGTVREVASRALSAFEKRGLLRTGRGRITIMEPARLESEARGSSRQTLP